MKRMNIIWALVFSAVVLAACDKSQDFLRDNTSPTGTGYAPISNNTLQDVTASPIKNLGTGTSSATVYAAGATFKTELTFFSQSPVKEINLYNTIGSGARTLVSTSPYASAFSQRKRLDTLLVPYTVPVATAGTVVKLEYEILNQNTFKATRTAYVKVQ
jgi:hypothetical protein